ncbi:MAG: DEAD/DEAH box helicase family protein [Chloroflexota bacterium]|nr:DEAD/DEAH box helicase family protein [Chloroflexota bacterium]
MVVVNRVLRQLTNYHGAMVVASTGLGKTIIGTHIAYVLQYIEQRIMNVMVIAPTATKKEWRRRLRSAGISADAVYTRDSLDRRLDKKRNQEQRQASVNLWCDQKKLSNLEKQQVRHICSLYLAPRSMENSIENLIG